MKLKDMKLTCPLDLFMLDNARNKWSQKVKDGNVDGIVRHGVYMGATDLFVAETCGREEYVLFVVFVAKIRRENEGLELQTTERKRRWYEMVKQFVSEFGTDRTPPDIVDCMLGCKGHLGL
jgi:hypothetical protein